MVFDQERPSPELARLITISNPLSNTSGFFLDSIHSWFNTVTIFDAMKHLNIPGLDLEFAYPKLTICASAAWATVAQLFNQYVFDDWEFLPFVIVLVILDTLTGVWKSLKFGSFSSYSFGGFMTKVILYAIYLFVLHGLTNFSSKDSVMSLFTWVEQLGYAAIIVRESVSIVENIGAISPKLIPTWILKRLRQFDKNGEFKPEEQNPNNTPQ